MLTPSQDLQAAHATQVAAAAKEHAAVLAAQKTKGETEKNGLQVYYYISSSVCAYYAIPLFLFKFVHGNPAKW